MGKLIAVLVVLVVSVGVMAYDSASEECPCPRDLNRNGYYDAGDIQIILEYWGQAGVILENGCTPDLDGSGFVEAGDISEFLTVWGQHAVGEDCPGGSGGRLD